MLIIVKNRDITAFNQRLFNFDALGRCNIFLVNATEGVGNVSDSIDKVLCGAVTDFNVY